jgi:hypothetical protein
MTDDRLITISEFVRMIGVRNRSWYYRHKADPGMPQQVVPVGSRAKVSYADALRYIAQLKEKARQDAEPVKRKRGRPRKVLAVTPPAA